MSHVHYDASQQVGDAEKHFEVCYYTTKAGCNVTTTTHFVCAMLIARRRGSVARRLDRLPRTRGAKDQVEPLKRGNREQGAVGTTGCPQTWYPHSFQWLEPGDVELKVLQYTHIGLKVLQYTHIVLKVLQYTHNMIRVLHCTHNVMGVLQCISCWEYCNTHTSCWEYCNTHRV